MKFLSELLRMTAELPRLYETKKEKMFAFLDKHPDSATSRHLRTEFPDDKKSTISLYLREWKNAHLHDAEIKEYIKDIYTMIYVMKYKMMNEKQWSAKETMSFERIALLLEKYRDLWEEPAPIPKTPPKPKKLKVKKKLKKELWKLDFNGD